MKRSAIWPSQQKLALPRLPVTFPSRMITAAAPGSVSKNCEICARKLETSTLGLAHCPDCSGRMNRYNTVISSVEEVNDRAATPTLTTSKKIYAKTTVPGRPAGGGLVNLKMKVGNQIIAFPAPHSQLKKLNYRTISASAGGSGSVKKIVAIKNVRPVQFPQGSGNTSTARTSATTLPISVVQKFNNSTPSVRPAPHPQGRLFNPPLLHRISKPIANVTSEQIGNNFGLLALEELNSELNKLEEPRLSARASSFTSTKFTTTTTIAPKTGFNVYGQKAGVGITTPAKKILVTTSATGKQEILEERYPGKYVKCSNPEKFKHYIAAAMKKSGQPILPKKKVVRKLPPPVVESGKQQPIIETESANAYDEVALEEETDITGCGKSNCPICFATFFSRKLLNSHMTEIHKHSRGFVCQYCSCRFCHLVNLISHKLQRHRNMLVFLCKSCGMESFDESEFRAHVNLQSVETFECNYCAEQFKSPVELLLHRKKENHVGASELDYQIESSYIIDEICTLIPQKNIGKVLTGSIKCPECPEKEQAIFANAKYLDLHIEMQHSGAQILPCQFCNWKFPKVAELISHKLKNHREKFTWICRFCGIYFAENQESNYCSHLNSHSIVTHDCRCGKQFATKESLENHGLNTHPDVEEYKCFQAVVAVVGQSGIKKRTEVVVVSQESPNKTNDSLRVDDVNQLVQQIPNDAQGSSNVIASVMSPAKLNSQNTFESYGTSQFDLTPIPTKTLEVPQEEATEPELESTHDHTAQIETKPETVPNHTSQVGTNKRDRKKTKILTTAEVVEEAKPNTPLTRGQKRTQPQPEDIKKPEIIRAAKVSKENPTLEPRRSSRVRKLPKVLKD